MPVAVVAPVAGVELVRVLLSPQLFRYRGPSRCRSVLERGRQLLLQYHLVQSFR